MKKNCLIPFLCFVILQIFVCKTAQADGYVNSYTYKTSSGEIVDLATKLGVAGVLPVCQSDIYMINNQINFCMRFNDNTYGFWNIVTNKITETQKYNFVLPKGAKLPSKSIYGYSSKNLLTSPYMFQGQPLTFTKDFPICHIVIIPVSGLGQFCKTSVQSYITIAYPDHHTYSFFLVSRLKKPEWVEPCGGYHEKSTKTDYFVDMPIIGVGVSPRVVYVEFVSLPSYANISEDIFLKITTNQVDHIVSFQNNDTFLIPLGMVNHQLELAGARRVKRQEIIQNIIDNYIKDQRK